MIFYIRWGTNGTASTRLRVNQIAPHLGEHSFTLPSEYQRDDVLIVQKQTAIQELRKARRQGAVVLYDIDDDWLDRASVQEMITEADLVTAGSHALHERVPRSVLVDDSLDWDGTTKNKDGDGKLVGWTGYASSAEYLDEIAPHLLAQGYRIRLITSSDYQTYFKSPCQYVVWSPVTVDASLAECDLCAYYLPQTQFTYSKGMNKLLKSWAIGIPCAVSPMPEYARAVSEAGVDPACLIHDWANLPDLKWEPAMREYALTFSPERVAEQWKHAIAEARHYRDRGAVE